MSASVGRVADELAALHYRIGLARMETKLALTTLFDRYPDLRLAVPPEELKLQKLPGWHRFDSLPVLLK